MSICFVRNFNIQVIEKSRNESFFSTKGFHVFGIQSDTSLLAKNAPSILADPFLFVNKNELYLFYEHQDKYIGGKGKICMRKTSDLQKWSD